VWDFWDFFIRRPWPARASVFNQLGHNDNLVPVVVVVVVVVCLFLRLRECRACVSE
jgi:hypothetical protein